jgi:hypothetical protein
VRGDVFRDYIAYVAGDRVRVTEVRAIGALSLRVPLAREEAPASRGLEPETHPTDTGEEIDEGEQVVTIIVAVDSFAKAAAVGVLLLHALWLLWVIFGAFFTRGRRVLTAVHLASLVWGLAVEVGPWPCPLTALEQSLQERAGVTPYSDSFIVHYLDRLVYPDISPQVLMIGGVVVCALNLTIYAWRWRRPRYNAL